MNDKYARIDKQRAPFGENERVGSKGGTHQYTPCIITLLCDGKQGDTEV